jgi:hypothetical protein
MSSEPSPNNPASARTGDHSLGQAGRLEPLCAGFEADWQAGRQPSVEDYLAQGRPADRLALLARLLALDLANRARNGERPTPAEYRARFLGDSAVIDEGFALFATTPEATPLYTSSALPATPPATGGAARTHDGRGGGLTDSGGSPSTPGTPGTSGSPLAQAGRYKIEGELARGGMGVVLRARDPDLNRPLAVKVLGEQYRGDAGLERRFREEAQITGQLQHPGIPPVHEVGVLPDGRPFFAMKLIEGRTLAALLGQRPSPADDLPRFVAIFEQVCQTLAYAHSRGVIHRDLKPSNIMVGAFGEVQVMDWGLAKVLASSRQPPGSRGGEPPEATSLSPGAHPPARRSQPPARRWRRRRSATCSGRPRTWPRSRPVARSTSSTSAATCSDSAPSCA